MLEAKQSREKGGGRPMAVAYCTEVHERGYRDRTILVENAAPVYRWEEREAVKKDIEERLYDVFCKYVSSGAAPL